MSEYWIGKSVSIHCIDDIGVFQGTIRDANASQIVITKAFRNGLPIKSLDTEVTIMGSDIAKIELLPSNNPAIIPHGSFITNSDSTNLRTRNHAPILPKHETKSNRKFNSRSPTHNNQKHQKANAKSPTTTRNTFSLFVPNKVEVKMTGITNGAGPSNSNQNKNSNAAVPNDGGTTPSNGNSNGKFNGGSSNQNSVTHKNEKKFKNRHAFNKNTFSTPVDDPQMDEEFDFEKNLALFDKKAIWNEIDAEQKPDATKAAGNTKNKNYRHDENILDAQPVGSRQIIMKYQCSEEYVTDDGILIPSLTSELRSRILMQAEQVGLVWERQCDMLSRGTVEMALQLLGGARRLSHKNQHQWPKIAIICDELFRDRHSDIGFSTGRQLASQGLKVFVYLPPIRNSDQRSSKEMELFKATGNLTVHRCDELPSCDLVILTTQSNIRNQQVVRWINDSRSPVMAVDPLPSGVADVSIKCSILPLLPLENISSSCGKLYLCNLSVPDSVFRAAGITYKSPFGHKFIIPLHLVNGNVTAK